MRCMAAHGCCRMVPVLAVMCNDAAATRQLLATRLAATGGWLVPVLQCSSLTNGLSTGSCSAVYVSGTASAMHRVHCVHSVWLPSMLHLTVFNTLSEQQLVQRHVPGLVCQYHYIIQAIATCCCTAPSVLYVADIQHTVCMSWTIHLQPVASLLRLAASLGCGFSLKLGLSVL
jgi:hypothetical protein